MPIRAEIDGLIRDFHFERVGLEELLHHEVAHDLTRRAIRVETSAKQHATGRPGPNVITGRLRGSITWRLGADPLGIYADVGTAVFYAPFVELGTSTNPPYPFLRPSLEAAVGE